MSKDQVWKLGADVAQLSLGGLQAEVSQIAPERGLTGIQWQAKSLANCRLLQLRSPRCSASQPTLCEAYVRGHDLVAEYFEADQGAAQPHVYWRGLSTADAAGVQLIVSMQTSLLDSQPESLLTSELAATEVLVLDRVRGQALQPLSFDGLPKTFALSTGQAAYLFLFRLPQTELSYVEMVHPGDFVAATLAATSTVGSATHRTCELVWRLFPEHLEKGVIRRSRIAGWFLPRAGDAERAAELFRQFVEEPLPLTA